MNSFKLWVESEMPRFLYWDSSSKRWMTTSNYRNIEAWIADRCVDIEHASPYHPDMKMAISELIKLYPALEAKELKFDGHSFSTINSFLSDKQFDNDEQWGIYPLYFYHGTSMHVWEKVKESGLFPRLDTGMSQGYGSHIPSSPNLIYLSGSFNNSVKFAARDASRRDKSLPVVLQIDARKLNFRKLKPDEDSKESTWQESLAHINSVGYEDSIPARFISLFSMWDKGMWTKV